IANHNRPLHFLPRTSGSGRFAVEEGLLFRNRRARKRILECSMQLGRALTAQLARGEYHRHWCHRFRRLDFGNHFSNASLVDRNRGRMQKDLLPGREHGDMLAEPRRNLRLVLLIKGRVAYRPFSRLEEFGLVDGLDQRSEYQLSADKKSPVRLIEL